MRTEPVMASCVVAVHAENAIVIGITLILDRLEQEVTSHPASVSLVMLWNAIPMLQGKKVKIFLAAALTFRGTFFTK